MEIALSTPIHQYPPVTPELFAFLDSEIAKLEKEQEDFITYSHRNFFSKKEKIFSVLLVEDSIVIQKVHFTMLESLGCRVDIASDGKEALKLFKKRKYDIILMDVGLPDISGIEVTAKMRAMENKNQNKTPIFALTTHSDPKIHQKCLDAGMNEVAIKPISSSNLKKLIFK